MPDINENRKAIYNALAKKGVNMGTYEQFDRAMSDTGNRKAVYDAARKHGINVGDYDTYENAIYASQQKLETKPVDAAVSKPQQASAAVQQPQTAPQQPVAKQQPQQPKGHPMTEEDKARMSESMGDMRMSIAAKTKNTSDWIEGISKRKPWDVGNVNIGTDLLANGQKRNKNVVQKGNKYITQSGNAYDTAEEANEEQEEIDWKNSNAAKVAKMQKELEGLDKQIADEEGRLRVQTLADKDAIMYSNEKYNTMQKELGKTATSGKLQQLRQRQQELRNSIANLQRPGVRASVERMNEDLTAKIGKAYEAAGNKYRESGREGFDKWLAPMGGESTAYGGGIQDAYNHDYDVQILESARRSIKNAQNLINEADINAKNGTLTDWLNRSFAGGAARGLGQSAFDLRTWDFGLNDAVEAKNLLNILKKADNGQKLTANEQALLDAKATEAATLAYFGNEAGRGYKAGQVTGMSLPFMVQFAVHPAAALGKTSQGMMMRYMVKRFGTAALKRSLASRMLTLGAKGAARLGGDIAASALITSTTGAGNVTAETMQKMAGNIQGDFTDKELKHIGYLGTKDREDATSAAVKSFVNNVLENFTEMGHVDVAGKWVKKGLAKITPKSLEKGLERFTQNDFAKALKELGQRTQFHGTIGEYLEEKEGDALRLILGTAEPGANWGTGKGGFFNLDENIDTFLGVSLMGGAFGVMGAAGYRTERYNARKAVENAGAAADAVFARVAQERNDADILTGENGWRQMRNTLSFGSDEEVKDVLTRVFTSDEFTPEQRKAVAQYAGAAYKMRGIKIAEAKAKAGGDNLMSAYDEGRSLSTAEEMNDARNMYEYRRKQAAEAMGISEDELDAQTEQSTPEMYLRVAMQQGADKGKAVEKYINSKARFDGMIDGLRDNINDKANEAEDAIRQNTNRSMEDAQVVEATLADGTHGYIVSGVVDVTEDGKVNASGTADFMTMRTDDGKVIAVAPSDIETASINAADALVEQARADIEEQESTAAEANIENGGLNVEQGAPVNFVDDSGQVVNAVSEGVTQTEDGQTIVSLNVNGQSIQMPLDALRGAVDRFNRTRAEQYARQEDATDIEQEGEGVQIEQGQTVTYVGADDTQYTATVMTEPDADGYVEIEVQLADGSKFVNRVKADELMQAATAIEGKPTTTAQTSEEEAQLPPPPTNMTVGEDGSIVEAQQPTEEQTRAIDRIPSHEANGTKVYDWEKAAPEDTYDALVETFGSMADKGVENSVKDIDKQLKAAEKALQKVENMTIEQMMANPNAIADAQNLVNALNERKKYWESVKNVPTARAAQAEEERKKKEAENALPPLPENVTIGEDGSLQVVEDNNEEKEEEPTTEATEETPVAEEKENEPTVTEEPTEAAPTAQQAEEQVREAEAQTDTNPTEAQKEAGNYRKGHVTIDGLDISIEQPRGSVRSGKDKDGKEWSVVMNNTYGYIRGTEGVDGDHIDIFLSDNPAEGDVFVVDQVNEDGTFDEHKVMYGFPDIESAREAYLANYSEGWQGLGAITPVSKENFKKWIDSSHRKTKPFAEYSSVETNGDVLTEHTEEAQQAANEDEQRDAVNKQVEKVLSEHGYHKGDMFRTHNMGNNAKAEIAGFDAGGVVLRTFDENGKQTAQYIEFAENFLEMVDNGYLEPITEERKESEEKADNVQQAEEPKERLYENGGIYIERETTEDDGAYEVYSLHNGDAVQYCVPDSADKRIADFKKPGEESVGTAYNAMGDYMFRSLEEAKEIAEKLRKRDAANAEYQKKVAEKEKAEAEKAEAEKERKRYGGFTDGKSPMQAANIAKVLDKLHNYTGYGTKAMYKHIEDWAKTDGVTFGVEHVPGKKTPEYYARMKDGSEFLIPKTAYDYAKFVGGKMMDEADIERSKKDAELQSLKQRYSKYKGKAERAERIARLEKALKGMNAPDLAKELADLRRLDELMGEAEKAEKPQQEKAEEKKEEKGKKYDFSNESEEEFVAFEKKVKDMSDEELLDVMRSQGWDENKANHMSVYDEYDARYDKKYTEMFEMYMNGLNGGSMSRKQVEGMLADAEKKWKDGGFANDMRIELNAQMDACREWLDAHLEKEEKKKEGKKPTAVKGKKIEDVGEKIGGARKDIASEMSGKINLNADTFPKMFPKFDLKKLVEKGLDPKMAAAVMFLRQEAMKVFKSKKKRSGTAEALSAAKFFAAYAKRALEEGNTDVTFTDGRWMFTEYGQASIKTNIELYGKIMEKMGTDMLDLDLSDYHIDPIGVGKISGVRHYAYRNDGKGGREQFEPHYTAHAGRSVDYLKEDERDKAFEFVINKLEQNVSYKNAHPYSLSVYRQGSKYFVGTRISGEIEHLTEDFDNLKDANEYLNANEADLQVKAAQTEQQKKADKKSTAPVAKLEFKSGKENRSNTVISVKIGDEYVPLSDELKDSSVLEFYKEHKDELQQKAQQLMDEWFEAKQKAKGWKPELSLGGVGARSGEDYRHGRDIDAEELHNTFGFRGIEFGNYVSQKERQKFLNETYDALMDLSTLLGISPKAIGLGGELGFAIGARGLGAKSGQAHYEPTYNVINLTKKSGAGALAHEWWHALDFFMNREGNTRKASATSVENAEGFSKETRKEMRDAFMHLMETIKGSEYYKRTKALEHRMHPDRASNQTGYFDQPTELGARAFQDYVQRRLMEKGVKNDFLSTFTPEESWNGEAENYPYPTGKDAEKIAEAIDNVFSTIQERTDEDGKAILYHKAEGTAEGVSERDAAVRDAIVERMREAGIEVVTDTEEAQRILDLANGEVNEHRVYHGTGADFDAFDHSHMGEGEGNQFFGWGTYVTEVEGIGRTYARASAKGTNELKEAERKRDEASYRVQLLSQRYRDTELSIKNYKQATGHHKREIDRLMNERTALVKEHGEKSTQVSNFDFYDYIGEEREYLKTIESSLKKEEDAYKETKKELLEAQNELEEAKNNVKEAESNIQRFLYTVDIPNDNGRNYIDWKAPLTKENKEDIHAGLLKDNFFRGQEQMTYDDLKSRGHDVPGFEEWLGLRADLLTTSYNGEDFYKGLSQELGGDEIASEFLKDCGFVGIKYPAEALSGGREDGAKNFVIFDENNAKITDKVRFFRTESGEAYGFVKDGKIYLDPRIAGAQTAVHEYTHLWAEAVRKGNPEKWDEIKGVLLNDESVKPFIDEVRKKYPELTNEDELLDEVLAHYSGKRGAERLRASTKRIADSKNGVFEKADVYRAMENLKNAIRRFWEAFADFMHVPYKSVDEIADRVMYDLLSGVNPRQEVEKLQKEPHKKKQLDIVTKANVMFDDYHTGIRTIDDIKTFAEAVEYGEGMDMYPDFTEDDAREALKSGEITVYSSKPIENGVFVSASRMEAEDYAGGGKVYEKRVPLTDVAWLFANEGQYAEVNEDIRFRDGEIGTPLNPRGERMTAQNTSLDEAIAIQGSGIRYSTRVNHNSPFLLKRADGSFVDAETGETLGFDHRFMGTGEGNQAHGWGSYFSANDIRRYGNKYGVKADVLYKGKSLRDDIFAPFNYSYFFDENGMYGGKAAAEKKYMEDIDRAIRRNNDYGASQIQKKLDLLRQSSEQDFVNVTNRHHYDVEIPDNDGTNYIEEKEPLSEKAIDRIVDALDKRLRDTFKDTKTEGFYEWVRVHHSEGLRQGQNFRDIREFLRDSGNTEEEISNVLHDAGFVGIHYDGRQDGECYVIFDESDAKIVNHERFRDAEETEQNAERDEDAMEREARTFADELGTRVRVVRDVNEIEHPDAATQNRMRESLGWFDPKSGEVVVVIPNNTDAADVRATVLHEIVGHKGLQQVVGKEKFEDFLMRVYRGVDVETRKKINEIAARNHWDFYEGIEEYIAQQAERGFEDRENAGLWRKIVQYVRDLLSEAKVRLGMNLGENDVRYMLWKTYQLKKNRRGVFAEAKDVALQNELGVGNYRYSRNVFGGNSGYVGYSKSKRAVRAENAGLRNKSQMNKEFADEVNELIKATNPDAEKVTLKQIKDALGDIKADEWHHTSMYGNRTNYYSAETIAKYFTPESEEEKTARESKANRYEEARAAYYDLHNELEKAAYDAMPKNENGKFVSSDGYEVMAQRNMLDKPQNLYNAGIIKGNRYYSGEELYFDHKEDYDRLEKEYNEAWQKAHDGVLTEDKKERLQQLQKEMNEADIDRYRFRDNGNNAATHPEGADNELRGVALEYNKRLGKGSYQAIEAIQDSMRSLLEVQRILEERSGKPLEDWENAYMAENAMSSRNNAEYEAWKRDSYKPLTEAVRALMESEGLSREGVEEYLYMKHGIERNREMSVRAAISEKAEREGKKAAHAEIRAQRDAAKQNGTDFKEPTDTERKRLEKQKAAEMQKQLRSDWKQKRDEIRNKYPNDWEKAQRELDKAATMVFGADLDAREYSGLTAIMSTDDVADARTRAYDAVKQLMEDRPQECKALDDAVRNAASITLEKPFRSGLIDRATFDDISDMYEYYIPLRGFSETTAEEVYNYLRGDAGHGYSEPIKRAKGRMSQAESPLTYLVQMAQSALVQGNRNIMKQRFYNMALRRPSDLITVSEAWVVKQLNPQTGAEEWVTAYPQIKPEMSADEVEKAVADFENDMMQREAQGEAFKTGSKKGEGIPYRTLHDQLAEHQVIVKRAGREYVLTVNGNPRLAQAINGKTNPNSNYEGVGGKVKKGLDDVNRKMSQLYTTANPDFVLSNLMRDTAYTWSMALIKEDATYAKSFIGHWNKNLPKMWTLYNKLQHNTLNMNDQTEREFKNFVMNGGETGYSTLQELEDIKAELDKDLAKGNVKEFVDRKLAAFDRLNRSVENLARFSAYLASRDAGRTVERSVYDAKEISVNFNKKGAGGMFFGTNGQTKLGNIASSMSAIGRGGYIFWNAGIQGMANIAKVAKRNPKKFTAGAAVGFALGFILAAIHGDDDDDELGYGDLPEYVRRSNIVIGGGKHYFTAPLPVEYRVMYGMGELAQRVLSGNEKYTNAELAEKITSTITQALPIDPMEGMSGGGKWYSPLIPSYAKPLAEVAVNSDWTGKPIYYENEWNKRNPEWTKVNENTTNSILFATSKMLNEWTGGDDFTSGALDINPAIVEHLAQGYLGGLMTFGNRVMKTGETIVGARDYDSRNIPFANRTYKQPTEYTKESRINSEYRKDIEDMRDLKQKERGYRQKAAEGNAEYAEKYRELVRSREYRKMLRFENLYKQVKKLNDDAGGDERAMKQVKRLKKDAVRVMDNEN